MYAEKVSDASELNSKYKIIIQKKFSHKYSTVLTHLLPFADQEIIIIANTGP